MKNSIKSIVLLVTISFLTLSFTNLKTETKSVIVENSTVVWKGYKVTGSHEGTIVLKSGSLEFDGEILTGGEFVIDMTTISSTDLEGEYKGKLDGHLKSDDFFGTESYPEASLKFNSVTPKGKNSYTVVGDLTIKGKTNPIEFEISIYGSKATASLKIDRSKYGVKYNSASFFENLKDKVIYDEFDIITDLEF
ncbi:YceI family protein [Urechidicola croceus]|uniref:Lipid-binding protein n=1 Tax=Urechidicola croceus TaxID=1850246 RepID=A0A1D8P5E9_9FLAO|nr:YceI family protein [Urechidicola croceus]AOW19797.1 lipid-binding protein [Urechidicola croceus]